MKFIEKDFPLQYINPVAIAEGNSKQPVYQIHKWWARRLGTVFRTIIISAFSDEKASNEDVWLNFINGMDLSGKIILDPFMGGGTTVVEALRLGSKVIGIDINPVAWFVTKKEIESVDSKSLQEAFKNLEERAGSFIKSFYRTKCPNGHNADVIYYFWVKVAGCPKCGSKVKLFQNYELSIKNNTHMVVCPDCLQVFEVESNNINNVKCPECGRLFNARKGNSSRGFFRCRVCNHEEKILNIVSKNGKKLDLELYALEGYCNNCGRFFKRVDQDDIELFEDAKKRFEELKETLLIPHQKIPAEGRSDPRPINHGYIYFKDMFNERQLLCLSFLLEEILKIKDINIREYMLLAFSDCLDANNMFCKYEAEWHKISLFFGLHAYHPIERPTENNVWGTKIGRGSFVKCFEKLLRAKEFCKNPFLNKFPHSNTKKEKIEGNVVKTFHELEKEEKNALLLCQTSEDLSFIPDKSIDAVITDPPYFDNIQYSELADFFYVWLRIGLKDIYPWFLPDYSGHFREVVQNEKLGKTIEFFSEGLKKVFTECHRVLKDDGLLIFTFHHNKLWAWESIGRILLDSGFYISASPIVRSEGKSGFHSSKGNIRYDCILVCRKRPSKFDVESWASLKELILKDSIVWARKIVNSGLSIGEVDIFTILMGKTLEYYTKTFPYLRERKEPITIMEALQEVKTFVDQVTERVQPRSSKMPKYYLKKASQLALFIKEAKDRYPIKSR